jgi:hypothetical protein
VSSPEAGLSILTNCNNNNFEISASAGMTRFKKFGTFYEIVKLLIALKSNPDGGLSFAAKMKFRH